MRKDKILKYSIYILGVFCLCIFIFIRVKYGLQFIQNAPFCHDGGDLYRQNYITDFREPLPPFSNINQKNKYELPWYTNSPKHPSFDSADIVCVGDSYFFFHWLTTFPERLQDETGEKVYYYNGYNPMQPFMNAAYKKGRKKVLIYEMGERGLMHYLIQRMPLNPEPEKKTNEDDSFCLLLSKNDIERKYNRVLQRGMFIADLYEKIATFKFRTFEYINYKTPVYCLNPSWLFVKESVNNSESSFFYQHTDKEIQTLCDNLKRIQTKLKEEYNMELVFMPIPSKISIYHSLVFENEEYNNFLPRLYKGLDILQIPYVDLYHSFVKCSDTLYYRTDTHWNEKGITIAINKTIEKLTEIGYNNDKANNECQ
ncbi:MAG: hypothetical protein JW717_07545 [Marinilabiliaceae bacterium]|nr:hypothetical protein [Marinilabiliaceae bacterium]